METFSQTYSRYDKIYYIHTDHLGSICKITDGDDWQNVIAEYNYDAYGRMRNSDDWEDYAVNQELLFDRGYTGHEHFQEFGIIHMNGRLYDPVLGRFFSPDNNIQAPTNSQNFNRYSYCLNNPLIYSDLSGECFAPAYFFATMFVADAMSNIINGYDAPLRLAWNNSTTTFNGMNNCLQLPIYQNEHTTINIGISPMILRVNASIKNRIGDMERSASIEYGMSGLFANGGVCYSNKKTSLGVGFGYGNNHWAWGVNGTIDGFGAGYYRTYYGDAIGPDGISNKQIVGGVNLFFGDDVSLRIENDFLGDKKDRWRSNGLEISYKDLSIGTYLYNNYRDDGDPVKMNGYSHADGSYGKWVDGQTYTSPLYFGYRVQNYTYRFGYSHPIFQHVTQNIGAHGRGFLRVMPFGHANFFLNYNYFNEGLYIYSVRYNPYSIWGK